MEYPAQLVKTTWLTRDVVRAVFALPTPVPAAAGQFMMITFPHAPDKKSRAYSLLNAPESTTPGSIHTAEFLMKYYPEGIAVNTITASGGSLTVTASGPRGAMVCPDTPPLTLIATGTGIAPLFSIITDQLKNKKNNNPIRLIAGFRTEDDILLADECAALAAAYPQFSYVYTVSRPSALWRGAVGRVTDHLDGESAGPFTLDSHLYLCGNPEMVKEVRTHALQTKNMPPRHVHFETW